MWYAVYRGSDGELVSIGTSVAAPDALEAAGLVAVELGENWSREGLAWDAQSRTFVAAPPPAQTVFTPYQFLTRFTVQERIAVRSSVDPIVIDFLDLLNKAQEIDITGQTTIAGVQYLVSVGLLTSERAAEVLS